LQGGSAVYRGGVAGQGSGEGRGYEAAQVFKVKIINSHAGEEVEVDVPDDRCACAQIKSIHATQISSPATVSANQLWAFATIVLLPSS
jgi:hypothetical protein